MSKSAENQQIELETIEMEHAISMGKSLNRLRKNHDFKRVILEGFFERKALDSVSLLAVPQIKDQNRRTDVMEDLIAISNLQYFFRVIDHQFEGATNPILSDEEEEEMQKEEEKAQVEQLGGVN